MPPRAPTNAADKEYENLMNEIGGGTAGNPSRQIGWQEGGAGDAAGGADLKPWQRGPTGGPAPWEQNRQNNPAPWQQRPPPGGPSGGPAPWQQRGGQDNYGGGGGYGGYGQGGYGGGGRSYDAPPWQRGGGDREPRGGGGGGPAPWQMPQPPQMGYGGTPGTDFNAPPPPPPPPGGIPPPPPPPSDNIPPPPPPPPQ